MTGKVDGPDGRPLAGAAVLRRWSGSASPGRSVRAPTAHFLHRGGQTHPFPVRFEAAGLAP